MKIATIQSLSRQGIECEPVDIEVDVANGLPVCVIVGLPDTAVSESRDRIRAALRNSDFDFPRTRITINLAPAYSKKTGAFDLPIALGILAAAGTVPDIPPGVFVGELALDGSVRPVRGALPFIVAASQTNQPLFLPVGNRAEAELVPAAVVFPVDSLSQLVKHCLGVEKITPVSTAAVPTGPDPDYPIDFADIVGQAPSKRALEIAAAGHHSLLFTGPPGSGKSLLAAAVQSILPPLNAAECVEVTMLHSLVAPQFGQPLWQRPMRSVHHTASSVAIIGGGTQLQPGELSLAHCGVLFLDELPEFRRDVIEALRQPLQDRAVVISRASGRVRYPADVLFIAAQNPCPCGYLHHPTRECQCSAASIDRYTHKISGPILDRFSMKIMVGPITLNDLQSRANITSESSSQVRQRVAAARQRQLDRQQALNSSLTSRTLDRYCQRTPAAEHLLSAAVDSHLISMRGYFLALTVARTIADLASVNSLTEDHVAEAIQYVIGPNGF